MESVTGNRRAESKKTLNAHFVKKYIAKLVLKYVFNLVVFYIITHTFKNLSIKFNV